MRGFVDPSRTDRELEHDGVVGREGIEGPLLDLDADVRDARGGRGAELAVRGGGNAQPVAGGKLDVLSGELATKLTGRYVELEVQTLSFKEYREMKRFLGQAVNPNPVAELDRYILEGGFPKALDYPRMADKRAYVSSVIREIFKKDIRRRVKVKNVSVFNRVRNYVINNYGATTSLTNILSDLGRRSVRIKRETLGRYLQILEDAKIISK